MKKSIFSIASFVVGVWFFLTALSQLIGLSWVAGILVLPAYFLGGSFYLLILGIILGIVGLIRRELRKKLAIIGIILCALAIICSGFAVKNSDSIQPIDNLQNY